MGSELNQALRRLCTNTEWNYAVFWKLEHRARMILTWEDAYYDNHERHDISDNKWFSDTVANLHDGHYSYDSLGLTVAKMSYHVYSLGEGIVGQVAVSGKHLWISADKHVTDYCSSFEHCDGWQTQFSVGIRTIAAVAVVPHGVVQLGSINKIAEDLNLVNHIREFFFELQDSLAGHIPSVRPCSMESSSCLSDVSTRASETGIFHDCIVDRSMDRTNVWYPVFPSFRKPSDHSYVVPLPGGHPRKTVETMNKHRVPEDSMSGVDGSVDVLQSNSENFIMEHQKQVHTKLVISRNCAGESSSSRDVAMGSEYNDTPSSNDFLSSKINLQNVTIPADYSGLDISYFPSDLIDCAPCGNQSVCVPEPSDLQILKDSEKNLTEINHMNTLKESFKFSTGCELYEALGPAFREQNTYSDWERENSESVIEMPVEEMGSSNLLTANSDSEHLLEAVVATVCPSGGDIKSAKSFCKSAESLLTTEKVLEPSSSDVRGVDSTGFSFDRPSLVEEDALQQSSKGFSSSRSRCSEKLDRPHEPVKTNKKRARAGENCRPRPRDRQLIQDRIRELRELVPNGSKCSIDSLLEQTIKHMLFMQCITKHANKLDKCAESKLLDKETGIRESSIYEQGSSWAMEVGSHLKVCPIKVENINVNGQMLVEMLCEDCSCFLEIAEAIRNLGLTIMKGVTESYDKKMLLCFVVEGQNNRSMHRMDILWSLMQILQSKTKI